MLVDRNQATFLSPEELRELTGGVIRRKQIEWLRRERWRFVVGLDGRPRVDRRYYDRRMLTSEQQEPPQRVDPDFAALLARR
jgi:uncharacterized protein DUF4224